MPSCSVFVRVGRATTVGVTAAQLLLIPQQTRAQGEPVSPQVSWVSRHVDLNLLPVAFVIPRGHLDIGGSFNLTPVGFPADTYTLYPNLLYGVTRSTEAAIGVTGAERLGPGGEGTFYMLGLQHQLSSDTKKLPAISLGGYGFLGPRDHDGGAIYLVASHQLTRSAFPRGVFAHLGLEFQGFSGDSSGSALQPFVGANYVWNRRVRFSAEFRPAMPWEHANLYSLRGVVLLTRRIGVSGGLRNNGYRVHPFIGLAIE